MSDESRVPDAVLVPNTWKGEGHEFHQLMTIGRIAKKMLKIDPAKGEKEYTRTADASIEVDGDTPLVPLHFSTRNPHDTPVFPRNHRRGGQPRFRWERQPDGSALGFYVDDEARQTAIDALARQGTAKTGDSHRQVWRTSK